MLRTRTFNKNEMTEHTLPKKVFFSFSFLFAPSLPHSNKCVYFYSVKMNFILIEWDLFRLDWIGIILLIRVRAHTLARLRCSQAVSDGEHEEPLHKRNKPLNIAINSWHGLIETNDKPKEN